MVRVGRLSSMVVLTICILPTWVAAAPPLPESWPALRARVRADPPPEELTRGKHYILSDEHRHDLFRHDIEGLGGIFIGVGTNQNYMMAAWAQPELLVIVDFDQVIIDLHKVYRVAFLDAETPAAFLAFWTRERSARQHAGERIRATYRAGDERQAVMAAFNEYRPNVAWGLGEVIKRTQALGITTFLDDPDQYAAVRRLFQEDRYLFVRGDFTGKRTLADMGKLAGELGLAVRVLYLSNVEQYFAWGRGRFRPNMLGLPMDERSVVVRAYGWGESRTADHNYRYYVQPGQIFHAWLRDRKFRTVRAMLASEQATEIEGFYRLGLHPNDFQADDKRRRKPG